jgi:hypothetical protein
MALPDMLGHSSGLGSRGSYAHLLVQKRDDRTGEDGGGFVDTYNIYMDELPTGEEFDGEEMVEVEFRVVPGSDDDNDPENNAVIAGLDLVDLINLRDALQQEIDNYALTALEAQATGLPD